jgi:hypothetical protein
MVYDFFKILFLIFILTMPKITALIFLGLTYKLLF